MTMIKAETLEKSKYYFLMLFAMLFWGVAWSVGKVAVNHSNAEISAFWRYAIAFISIIPVIVIMKRPVSIDRIGLLYVVSGGLFTALFNYLFFQGLAHGQAGYGGTLVTSISPILTYLFSIAIFGVMVSGKQIFALSVGILGAILLLHIPQNGLGFLNQESIYFVIAALTWSVVTMISQKASKRVDAMFFTMTVFGFTALVNMLFALPYHPFDVARFDMSFWWSILFMGIIPGTFSTAMFFISAGKVGAHNAAVFMFIVPIGAIVSSMLMFDEKVATSTLIGCILAFLAVLLFNYSRAKSP